MFCVCAKNKIAKQAQAQAQGLHYFKSSQSNVIFYYPICLAAIKSNALRIMCNLHPCLFSESLYGISSMKCDLIDLNHSHIIDSLEQLWTWSNCCFLEIGLHDITLRSCDRFRQLSSRPTIIIWHRTTTIFKV